MLSAEYLRPLIVVCVLLLLWSLETLIPAMRGRHDRLRHAARNLTLGTLNAVALTLLAGPPTVWVAARAESSGLGLLRALDLSPVVSTVLAVLLLDAWMYLWHRANHQIPFLWRFHRVHHSDSEMDVTSAVRFHTGEILISGALRFALIPLLGVSLWHLLVYELLLLPVILFHHSNVYFPEKADRWLRAVLVSPSLHRVHHSRVRRETDSNYASVFSCWDRMCSTFRLRKDGRPVAFGLDEYDGEQWQRMRGLLAIPFAAASYRRATKN
jgi:sterol desaturase/sphingolipid hydroxylase (fatty acid hydroxylase superfamily)